VWIVDTKKEHLAVDEARKLGLPVIAILDTNCDPDEVDYKIPGNDDAIRSVTLLTRVIADAVAEGLIARSGSRTEGEQAGTVDEPLAEWERELLGGDAAQTADQVAPEAGETAAAPAPEAAEATTQAPAAEETPQAPAAEATPEAPAAEATPEAPAAEEVLEAPVAEALDAPVAEALEAEAEAAPAEAEAAPAEQA
jgi:small subunit ribosomal protein S2